jgi:hypothetical protein
MPSAPQGFWGLIELARYSARSVTLSVGNVGAAHSMMRAIIAAVLIKDLLKERSYSQWNPAHMTETSGMEAEGMGADGGYGSGGG